MSYTIQTNSGSKFLTNSNEESLLGALCELSGAKYKKTKFDEFPSLAYEMTEEEATDTAFLLESLKPVSKSILENYHYFFTEDYTTKDLEEYLDYIAETLRNSKGYKCLS
jgi:hypothetical protein